MLPSSEFKSQAVLGLNACVLAVGEPGKVGFWFLLGGDRSQMRRITKTYGRGFEVVDDHKA